MMITPAAADALTNQIAPTGKLGSRLRSVRPAARSGAPRPRPAMPAFRSISARRWPRNSASPSTMSCTRIPVRSPTRRLNKTWDITFLPRDAERETKMTFGPIYEVADATYIVKPGSTITNFAALDQDGVKVAAVNATTHDAWCDRPSRSMPRSPAIRPMTRSSISSKSGEIDAFALSRDQLNAMARKIPGTRVLDETFKQTVTAVAVPLDHPLAAAFATKFMTEAIANGTFAQGLRQQRPEGHAGSHRGEVTHAYRPCPPVIPAQRQSLCTGITEMDRRTSPRRHLCELHKSTPIAPAGFRAD